jgi:hypothetical protein
MSFLWLSVNKCIPLRNFILERQQIMLVEGRKSHLIWYLLNGCKLKGGSWNSSSPVARKWFWSFKSTKEKTFLGALLYEMPSNFHVQVNLCQKLFFLQNMGRTCCVQKLFWMSETISVHNIFSPGLSLEFSCIELIIQWTICRHIVG